MHISRSELITEKSNRSDTSSQSKEGSPVHLFLEETHSEVTDAMWNYANDTIRRYWRDYLDELDRLAARRLREGSPHLADAARAGLDLCRNLGDFLLLRLAAEPGSVEVAEKRSRVTRAVNLVTRALGRELPGGQGLN